LLNNITISGNPVPEKMVNIYNTLKAERIGTVVESIGTFINGIAANVKWSSFCTLTELQKILPALSQVEVIGAERISDFSEASADLTFSIIAECNVFKIYLTKSKAYFDFLTCNSKIVLAEKVKRAAELISYCQGKLRSTEKEVTGIIEQMEKK
jgi:hypothetical protein